MTCDVVCIGAHPDDVEIGMGATVAKMAGSGLRVALIDLTDGEPTPHGTPETRRAEAHEAARLLGVAERFTLSGPNRYLMDTVEARTELAETLRELRPRTMFVPYPLDAHPDHVAAHRIAVAARFYSKFTKTEMRGEPHYAARIFQYMAVHMRLAAEPSFVVDVSEQLGAKLAALSAYVSQFSANESNAGILPMVEQTARWWGTLIRTEAGEPFFTPEPIGIRSIEDLV